MQLNIYTELQYSVVLLQIVTVHKSETSIITTNILR